MKIRSKYQVSVRQKAITSVKGSEGDEMSVEAEVNARPSIQILPGGLRILSISGPGLWSKIVMCEKEAERVANALLGTNKVKTETKIVHYARKSPYGGGSWL